jgi:hypothetical protein
VSERRRDGGARSRTLQVEFRRCEIRLRDKDAGFEHYDSEKQQLEERSNPSSRTSGGARGRAQADLAATAETEQRGLH